MARYKYNFNFHNPASGELKQMHIEILSKTAIWTTWVILRCQGCGVGEAWEQQTAYELSAKWLHETN